MEEELVELRSETHTDLSIAKKMIQLYQSAQSRGLDFDLKFSTIKKLLHKKKCFYTKQLFEKEGLMKLSIDRVDSAKGYIEGNVVACTTDINSKKSNLTAKEIESLYIAIKLHSAIKIISK